MVVVPMKQSMAQPDHIDEERREEQRQEQIRGNVPALEMLRDWGQEDPD